ncbi:MAG: 30S ribosomal protein S9 [Pirellulales bacterium]|nr:30S ribosomal protein S9 [Pirellulales bacterium]
MPLPTADHLGTGRRKKSIVQVRLRPGEGKITVNGRPLDEYFYNVKQQKSVLAPLELTGKRNEVDVKISASGGGFNGQADACKMAIARALRRLDETLAPTLRDSGMLTRDSRMKERKKYGFRGARRGTQFSKR